MSNADDLKRLAEEMAVAYETRVSGINLIKKETVDLLNTFGKSREEMADNLRAELAKVKPELQAAESERKAADQAELNQRSVDIENLLSDFDTAHQEMADNLRAELAKVKPELQAAESERKAKDQAEIRETTAAWKELLSAMQTARGHTVVAGPVEVEVEVEVKTVEEVIEEPAKEAEEVEEVEEEEAIEEVIADEEEEIEEDLGGRILDLLEDNTEGLKMTQIADMLGIESWRILIPVIRGLIDDEEIRKEGTLYFQSE